MSLLDKQEVQDICDNTVLRARKLNEFTRKVVRYTEVVRISPTEERRKKTIWQVLTSHGLV